MSYDLYLVDPKTKEVLTTDQTHHLKGGTYALGGTCELHLNVTYNYAKHFRTMGEDGIRTIYGMSGLDSIPVLWNCAKKLNSDVSKNYWEATEGNAREALFALISLAAMGLDGIWEGD